MTLTALSAYCTALLIAAAIPGPGITAIVARALGSGFRETLFMGLGLVIGDIAYLTAVILGLALVAQTFAGIFIAIKFAGALYLVYIAWKLWTAGLLPEHIAARGSSGPAAAFLSGLLVTLGNPKTMLFYIALVPTLIDIGTIGPDEYSILLAATFCVLMAVLIPYMLLAARARTLLKKPRALQVLNRMAAAILASTAAFIATRTA
ncbi:LysE family translocator [Rhizobiaceae bacterium n13]|uniref:LysE family translocator n=1 Tax=Ferirhizobium litorale TaxID=2927786 RepID=A0AAE3QH72_9HYPH|nr:LysE family translocator [Fererhizobium litorale]MDI7864773.1 LysE family translocator [Fererhizobium litorale]MDI7924946.1 LysE family translocator [Fererhizobium litorale]